jgi:hypothetical protein
MSSASDLPAFKNEYGIQFLQLDLCFLIFNEVNKVNIGKVNLKPSRIGIARLWLTAQRKVPGCMLVIYSFQQGYF